LGACERGSFSTEEDFVMRESEPFDGDPYISDGDLLSFDGRVCLRNAMLLATFYPNGRPPLDLGLDAADVIDVTDRLVAFSTELDDPFGHFTAGDLLITNGTVIPNRALVDGHKIGYDIGLDALQFVGEPKDVFSFLEDIEGLGREYWLQRPGALANALDRRGIDIWFSIEGTSNHQPPILDGDLLSAMGTVTVKQADMLPTAVPAGIPQRGVDFGLDAVARVPDVQKDEPRFLFSTEILFRGQPGFTDGDALREGDGVAETNEDLVKPFAPAANFLGLDALDLPFEPPGPDVTPTPTGTSRPDVTPTPTRGPPPQEQGEPMIQYMCGDRSVGDFGGGLLNPTDPPGNGMYLDEPKRPCGEYVPIDGFLPTGTLKRFRVAFRSATDLTVPAIGAASGIRTNWKIYEWNPAAGACKPTGSLNTDSDGWMDAAAYLDAKAGGPSTGFCANSGLRLAVWDTAGHSAAFAPPDKNGRYRLWLEWEYTGGATAREPVDHTLQLDNEKPQMNDLEVKLPDGSTPLLACGEAPDGTDTFKVYGDFDDPHYWGYHLAVRGGDPPKSIRYPKPPPSEQWHNYYDVKPDGVTPQDEVQNTGTTGTKPSGATVHLRDVFMVDFGASFKDCCYLLNLWVRDAAIRHHFNGRVANDASGSHTWWGNAFITFAAAPSPTPAP
jgi:hypothetical protein